MGAEGVKVGVVLDPLFSLLTGLRKNAFQQIGVDAVAYFESDVVMAGSDVTGAFSTYFTSRQIKYLLFFEKVSQGYQLIGVTFDGSQSLFDPKLPP